ncbi:MAG: cardiolipin synthase B [Proteobacteria bacterium]|nr:cardiolipin synthase B [Pseudomonadota bacterium]
MKSRPWSRETVYFDHATYFTALLKAVEDAKSSIDLETYIFELDQVGRELVARLVAASRRGVRVRLILDGVGTWLTHEKIRAALEGSRVEMRIHHPFSLFGFAFSQLNKRLHRKVLLVDRKVAFAGSFNITSVPNRDTGVRLEGGAIDAFLRAFETLWSGRFLPFRRSRSTPLRVRLNESKRLRRLCNRDLSRRIGAACRRIRITNAYFVPPFFLLRDLCHAGLRGVDVRMILPEKPDHRFMKWLSSAFYRTLLSSGVRVFEYRKTFLHAKSWIIDEWVMVGSTNLNHRSLIHDLEVDVVLGLKESKEALEQQFEIDCASSVELSPDTFRVGWLSRVLQWILLRFRFYA